jgi:hypothetical protein
VKKLSEETKERMGSKERLYIRYEWLDQFKGVIIIFLINSVIIWPLFGDPQAGT